MNNSIYADLFSVFRENMNAAGEKIFIDKTALELFCSTDAEYPDFTLLLERSFESRESMIQSIYALFLRRSAGFQEVSDWLEFGANKSNQEFLKTMSQAMYTSIEYVEKEVFLNGAIIVKPVKTSKAILMKILKKSLQLAKKHLPTPVKTTFKKIYYSFRRTHNLRKSSCSRL